MNTAKLKAYAPQARKEFIKAVTERANYYGIFSDDHIEPIEFKGDVAIVGERAFTKKEGELREKLVNRIKVDRFELVMRAYAYTWFNRFVALRYMELHDYLDHGYRVLSNNGGSDIPEILDHAADVNFKGLDKDKVVELRLAGNQDNELYRLLIVAHCNALHKAMPFLFEQIDSEAELLLPDNLLHSNSPIRKMVNAIDEEDWNDVEIIGWIYQFYISERKDEVIGKVVKSEDIPAATQLFTPNWIVKYMVQNTLGRMWLATYPDSLLKYKMEYYIEPVEQEPEVQKQLDSITPKELNPEEITFLDPACGSGHILVEAYDIFKEIYLERGYRTKDIPRLILEKNLYGLDIDDRAAQLACFAILMKAREDDRRVLGRDALYHNVSSIQESDASDLKTIEIFFKNDETNKNGLKEIVKLFENAKTFGALISVPDNLEGKSKLFKSAIQKNIDELFSFGNVERLKGILRQTEMLENKYNCVVTNPPYMGGKGMNSALKKYAKTKFPDSKSDIFAMFTENIISMTAKSGCIGLVMPYVWMFLSSYESFRKKILNDAILNSLIQLEYNAFEPACVPVATLTLFRQPISQYKGDFIKLSDFRGHQNQAPKTLMAIQNPNCDWRHSASTADFKKIPGNPIAYWITDTEKKLFKYQPLLNFATFKEGITTANNNKFLRHWYEIDIAKITFKSKASGKTLNWVPYNKGGAYRKWYGNQLFIIDWQCNGSKIKKYPGSSFRNPSFHFKKGATFSALSSSSLSVRYSGYGFAFDSKGTMFFSEKKLFNVISYLNSNTCKRLLALVAPTLDFRFGTIQKLPFLDNEFDEIHQLIHLSKYDWDSYEISWEFTSFPLLHLDHYKSNLKETYTTLRNHCRNITLEMQRLEEDNNRIYIKTYGLQDELKPDVHLTEITLTFNPHYRYGGNKSEEELETLLLCDTIKELISYSIGCMMGRYSLDQAGLIYAHSGNKGFDSSKYRTFPADDDGIIPIMDEEWFTDDATNRFTEFLKVVWSQETLDENLRFVADSLKPKNNEAPVDTIRRYLSTNFFKDHIRTYKKRPIYWLFSSGKQKAFECLVYLHRYNESTLSRIRSSYVTPLQGNISARFEFLQNEKDAAASASAQRKFQKEIDVLRKKQTELSAFDDELRHYADMKISLDLDDGVKVNYGKFGNLLAEKKTVTGKK